MIDFKNYEQHNKEPFAACENPAVPMGKWLLDKIPEKPRQILDVGCGTGVHTKWFAEQGIESHGITINLKEIEKRLYPNVNYGDMLSIPFKDKSFDCVFCLGTLEHTHSPFIALSEFNRVLRMGKYLFFDMPGIATMGIINKEYLYHKMVLFPIQVRDLLLRTNFTLIGGGWTEKIDGSIYTATSGAHYLARKDKDIT